MCPSERQQNSSGHGANLLPMLLALRCLEADVCLFPRQSPGSRVQTGLHRGDGSHSSAVSADCPGACAGSQCPVTGLVSTGSRACGTVAARSRPCVTLDLQPCCGSDHGGVRLVTAENHRGPWEVAACFAAGDTGCPVTHAVGAPWGLWLSSLQPQPGRCVFSSPVNPTISPHL